MSDRDLRTSELNRLEVLNDSVKGLRGDLSRYRKTLDRYLRRGAAGLGILLVLVALLVTSTVATVVTARNNDRLLDSIARSEARHEADVQNHRVRNELLHSCIVELIFTVINAPPPAVADIENPCPEPIDPEEGAR